MTLVRVPIIATCDRLRGPRAPKAAGPRPERPGPWVSPSLIPCRWPLSADFHPAWAQRSPDSAKGRAAARTAAVARSAACRVSAQGPVVARA